tara:strand:+ start:15220 stop:16254 length:1035 start_codon:yes stop_codon:yes gene_type:complete
MAEATKIDWAEELREEMKKGREGAAKNALSGEDDTFAEWSESFEEGQSPADLAGAESEGAGVGWTLSELIVPGVGEAMDLRMMEEGRQEGDQTKVAMGMIGLALPGALGAVWRKFGGPVARRLAKKVADKEITPKEAAVRATKHSMKKLKEKTDAQDKASGLSIEARKHFDPEAIEDSWKGVDLKQDLDFLEAQPDEWFEKAASVRNVDQAMDRLKIAQSQAKGAGKWRRTRLSEAEEGVKSARAASPTSRHEDLLAEADRASVGRGPHWESSKEADRVISELGGRPGLHRETASAQLARKRTEVAKKHAPKKTNYDYGTGSGWSDVKDLHFDIDKKTPKPSKK